MGVGWEQGAGGGNRGWDGGGARGRRRGGGVGGLEAV